MAHLLPIRKKTAGVILTPALSPVKMALKKKLLNFPSASRKECRHFF